VLNYQCSSLHEYDANGELCKKRRCNREHTCAHCSAEIRHFESRKVLTPNTGKTREEPEDRRPGRKVSVTDKMKSVM
jgi:hypothetical protein